MEEKKINVKRKRGTREVRFTCTLRGGWESAAGHAVPEYGYDPRVILVCLEVVFLAQVLFTHIGGWLLEEKPCANKSSFNFFQLISSFFVSVREASGPPSKNQLTSSIKAIFKRCSLHNREDITTHKKVN